MESSPVKGALGEGHGFVEVSWNFHFTQGNGDAESAGPGCHSLRQLTESRDK